MFDPVKPPICGFPNVVKRSDGRYQCTVCERYMPEAYEAQLKAQGLPLPKEVASHV